MTASTTPSRGPLLKTLLSLAVLGMLRITRHLPLSWLRALGAVLGWLLYALVGRRRRIAEINLALCFPQHDAAQRRRMVRQHFVLFAQAWLDRGWLWEGSAEQVRSRLRLRGAVHELQSTAPTLLFAPHFVGMDAGWIGLTAHVERRFCGLYARQRNPVMDQWMAEGRRRFGEPHIVAKSAGLKALVSALRAGEPLYLLPDMDYGPRDSVFVPFYGVTAATIPSLSRFARMGGARVLPILSRLTPEGYDITVLPPWQDFPTEDVVADTARMNRLLQEWIDETPEQYYWVHKRFKTRPAGEASFYR
ncbi:MULTISPECIES: lysophospholipid acyltransferase family protein [Hydrogenophaga]|jgi:KDO2-lipid IV(A) lauroyltransferase|uniref:Lipid A biosynthesis lauroyl acyltransferase n=1 Tax=Hydrogenophaga pseudoflava TaxID=47421 RepID=A0A4P6X438_HYDPS|nr:MULTISPECIES: lipid A biosynthesis acyltransferase [Hydrogenophaga]QBM29959.1 Lipid A biosynthesis lauroyl acyltransferase [Hydrogenophaga pseudoflava]